MKIQIKRDKYGMLYECQHVKGVNIGSGYCTDKCEYNKYNNDIKNHKTML